MEISRGDVLYDNAFLYPRTTETCDKLLLVINNIYVYPCDIVIVPATTNKGEYHLDSGCNESYRSFYFNEKIGFYVKETILQFSFITTISSNKLDEMIISDRIRKAKGEKTTKEEFGQILNCLKKIKEDIPLYIQELIF